MILSKEDGARKAVMLGLTGTEVKSYGRPCVLTTVFIRDALDPVFRVQFSDSERGFVEFVNQIEIPDLTLDDLKFGDIVQGAKYTNNNPDELKGFTHVIGVTVSIKLLKKWRSSGKLKWAHLISRSKEGVKVA
jgi:hypothetical protein